MISNIIIIPFKKDIFKLKYATEEGDWILDFFLGSGTTAAVAHKMKRNWIDIELDEHCQTHYLPRLKEVYIMHKSA